MGGVDGPHVEGSVSGELGGRERAPVRVKVEDSRNTYSRCRYTEDGEIPTRDVHGWILRAQVGPACR